MKPQNTQPLLIFSDGKPGHVNQSIAFARHLDRDYFVCRVAFKSRAAKGFSYLADRCGLYLDGLFRAEELKGSYAAIVSAGSETYYANRTMARRLGIPSVAIMLPQGYRFDFDLIVAQQHDNPPERDNIISLPINLTYVEPQGIVVPGKNEKVVAFIVGGDTAHAILDPDQLHDQISQAMRCCPGASFWLSTSRRTPPGVEAMLQSFSWDYALYYSQNRQNPLADFLQHSCHVFLTADSTSMISEAVSYGSACVEVFAQASVKGKLGRMLKPLIEKNTLALFNGHLSRKNTKICLSDVLLNRWNSIYK